MLGLLNCLHHLQIQPQLEANNEQTGTEYPRNSVHKIKEVCTLTKLVMVMPATNAISECSFSAVCNVKSYLRSTMTQKWLNYY